MSDDKKLVTGAARLHQASLKNWGDLPDAEAARKMKRKIAVHCGWGRLIFGQTFDNPADLADCLKAERSGERDVALYVREPHLVLARSPQTLFLDPSHCLRLDLGTEPKRRRVDGFVVRPARPNDGAEINRLYLAWSMVPIDETCLRPDGLDPAVTILVVEDPDRPDKLAGVVMGVDHHLAIDDPDNGASLWALAVDPNMERPGAGEHLVAALANEFRQAGRAFMDLSVMHDNPAALSLYRKMGFEHIPVYCVKKKNRINEKLFIGPTKPGALNPYAQIIVDEALRRGIAVEIEDSRAGLIRLSHGGRSVSCRESLSDLTSAVALSRCDDKTLTNRLLKRVGLEVPAQIFVTGDEDMVEFRAAHPRLVVKPARGEQGRGVSVDLKTEDEVAAAVDLARNFSETVILEEFVEGQDLRIIVIDGEVVAAAIRQPPVIRGDGTHTVRELAEKLSRRRAKATGGESKIPFDRETERCVGEAGFAMDDVVPAETAITLRKTANLHTGGQIHDVTQRLHPVLEDAARRAAGVLEIPVVGLDFVVTDPGKSDYVIIEANERPGLANHEPQPTAERFIDLLFPQTVVEDGRTSRN